MSNQIEPKDQLINITRADGVTKEIRVLDGHLFVCQGCCCGRTDKGFPAVPIEEFKREWKERGMRKHIHLTISGCLGPCALANVVLIVFAGQVIWLHSINSVTQVKAIFDYLGSMLACGHYLVPTGVLAECHFNRYTFEMLREADQDDRHSYKL
ncbi:MAG: (2Fe-2S) ferredoxin domain-containing protein [Acidobacteriota bacterium]